MSSPSNRRLAMIFGLIGALFFVLEGLLGLVEGAVLLAFGHGYFALGVWGHAFVVIVVGIVVGFFSFFGRSRDRDRGVAAGVVLIVIVVLGWLVLGLAGGVLALLGALFVIIAGVLFLVSSG